MADHLTLLENKLEERFNKERDALTFRHVTSDWSDYNYRIGYLQAIRDVGRTIKEVRSPELEETGEIFDILAELKI